MDGAREAGDKTAAFKTALAGALIGRAGMPVRIGVMHAAKPLPALRAAALPRNFAGYFPGRDALAGSLLGFFLELFHGDLLAKRREYSMATKSGYAFHDRNFVHAAAGEVHASVGGGGHIADGSAARRNGGAGELLGLGIELNECIWLDSGFAIPH